MSLLSWYLYSTELQFFFFVFCRSKQKKSTKVFSKLKDRSKEEKKDDKQKTKSKLKKGVKETVSFTTVASGVTAAYCGPNFGKRNVNFFYITSANDLFLQFALFSQFHWPK